MRGHRVVALAHPPIPAFELGCIIEIFARDRPELQIDWYDFKIAALVPGRIEGTGGLAIDVDHGREALEQGDTIIVPSWDGAAAAPPDLLGILRQAHGSGKRIVSICSGAFLLAEAGLLNSRRATTHWMYATELQKRFPEVRVDADVLYVDDGGIITAAGSAAGLDMMLHLVRKDHGPTICNAVARRLNIPPYREGGQSQFAVRPVPAIENSRLSEVIAWMREHSTEDLSIDLIAERAAMSPRTFFRRFRDATGEAPYEWLINERVAVAKEMLEAGRLSIDQIAFESGFGGAETLRHHFKRIVGCTPADYRRIFGPEPRTAPIAA